MKKLVLIAALFAASSANAATIAQWTFETSQPATAGSFAAEVGTGSALGSHTGASIYSSPAGNGSAHSFSSNTWAVGDYYQFRVSTVGMNAISLAWDQTSSGTGPKNFKLAYSTNGTIFTDFASYSVLANASPNPVWNSSTASSLYSFSQSLNTVTALNNQANVFFRLIDTSTASASSGTVASGGTDRVDNFTVFGVAAVPEADTYAMLLAGLGVMGFMARRRK
jgi:hypothetical protein